MSLIQLAAPLIRLAAADDGYALDLDDAVAADDRALEGLVAAEIQPDELGVLKPTEWLWFARWRQALGGGLDREVLFHLARYAATPFARFEVRSVVLCDDSTNGLAREFINPSQRPDDIGLDWLTAQAQDPRVDPRELALDSLQCATEASWFVLRQLTSLDDERGQLVRDQLDRFAAERDIGAEVASRWRYHVR
jgi:hypothetical protein